MANHPRLQQRRSISAADVPVKLRSACDACSIAKVKCDKKQPACDRCWKNGFACSYSPSRRHGKQPWAEMVARQHYLDSARLALPTPTSIMSPAGLSHPPHYRPNSRSGFDASQQGLDVLGGPAAQPEQAMDVDVAERQSHGCSTLADLDMSGDGLDFLSHWSFVDSEVHFPSGSTSSESATHDTAPSSTSNSTFSGETSTLTTLPSDKMAVPEVIQPQAHDCEAKAFTILHSLHFCTMFHTDRPGAPKQPQTSLGTTSNRTPPLDKILYFNRVAVSTLKELLDCSCAQQQHLMLLYMTIISKTLFWYRLAISPQHQAAPAANHAVCSASESPECSARPRTGRGAKATPIQIGVFDLEEEDQRALIRSVLLREVRKVESVVQKIQTLGSARDDDVDDEQRMPGLHRVASSEMALEVKYTLKQIKELCTGKKEVTWPET